MPPAPTPRAPRECAQTPLPQRFGGGAARNERGEGPRCPLPAEISGPLEKRAEDYIEFIRSLAPFRRARATLASSAPHVLYDAPQPERTTSVIEREMREVNRRIDVGVRWTVRGIDHPLRLRHAKRINPDDFERVWSEVQEPSFTLVPLP